MPSRLMKDFALKEIALMISKAKKLTPAGIIFVIYVDGLNDAGSSAFIINWNRRR